MVRSARGRGLLTLGVAVAVLAVACGGSEANRRREAARRAASGARSQGMQGANRNDQGRCEWRGRPDREVSEYDTTGDDVPDVRKVFRRVGDPPAVRLILVCREVDLNGDGIKDVVRYYDDEGSPLREEADRNFDGRMDLLVIFQDGMVVRKELDTNGDGIVDAKIFYEDGKPFRAERDSRGRSTATHWQPDTWEYYEKGRLVRVGVDLDGDGRVDRWDRDEELQRQLAPPEEEEGEQDGEGAQAGGEGDGEAASEEGAEG